MPLGVDRLSIGAVPSNAIAAADPRPIANARSLGMLTDLQDLGGVERAPPGAPPHLSTVARRGFADLLAKYDDPVDVKSQLRVSLGQEPVKLKAPAS
jgi:hypothetical protein